MSYEVAGYSGSVPYEAGEIADQPRAPWAHAARTFGDEYLVMTGEEFARSRDLFASGVVNITRTYEHDSEVDTTEPSTTFCTSYFHDESTGELVEVYSYTNEQGEVLGVGIDINEIKFSGHQIQQSYTFSTEAIGGGGTVLRMDFDNAQRDAPAEQRPVTPEETGSLTAHIAAGLQQGVLKQIDHARMREIKQRTPYYDPLEKEKREARRLEIEQQMYAIFADIIIAEQADRYPEFTALAEQQGANWTQTYLEVTGADFDPQDVTALQDSLTKLASFTTDPRVPDVLSDNTFALLLPEAYQILRHEAGQQEQPNIQDLAEYFDNLASNVITAAALAEHYPEHSRYKAPSYWSIDDKLAFVKGQLTLPNIPETEEPEYLHNRPGRA